LCDYADQSEEHISFIAAELEIIKGEIASFHEKVNKCHIIQRGGGFLAWRPAVSHWKNPELGLGRKLTSMDDEVINLIMLNIVTITVIMIYTINDRTIFHFPLF
jgi:hypothetical protein